MATNRNAQPGMSSMLWVPPAVAAVLVELLKQRGAIGRENAVTADPLAAELRLANHGEFRKGAGRVLRAMAHCAPFYGFPVCADVRGYYLAADSDELEQSARRLEAYMAAHASRAAALRQCVAVPQSAA